MRYSLLAAITLFTLTASFLAADEPTGPPQFLEVEGVAIRDTDQTFNKNRPYLISVNSKLPDAKVTIQREWPRLHDSKRLDDYVLQWFGKDEPRQINLAIGTRIPVETAQAILAAFAVDAKLPVHLARLEDDAERLNTRRMYVGSLLEHSKQPLDAKQLQALLNPLLTRDEFMKLLPAEEAVEP